MENVIKITDKILGVIVPESAFDFNLCKPNIIDYWKDFEGGRSGEIELLEGTTYKDWKIHGTCTLPAFDFEFEVTDKMASCSSSCSQSDYHKGGKCDRNGCYGKGKKGMFANKIQKAIQDEGMFVVNPYGENKPQELVDYTGRKDGIIANSLELEQWKSSESKTVKKLLIIEKN